MKVTYLYFLKRLYRMPTISVFVASSMGVQLTAQPSDTFLVVLQQSCSTAAAAANMPLEPLTVLYSHSNVPVPVWQEAQHPVGTQNVTVIMQAAPLSQILASLMGRVSTLGQSDVVLAGPRISNTAAQVLLHAAGEEYRTTTSITVVEAL